jgi:SulP family sulfate permease
MNRLNSFVPDWIRNYKREHLSDDLIAGVLVTILVLPQSLAYAILAGLPPQLGLYASVFPVLIYALIGSSMIQAVGPVAITAIMTFALLSPLETPGSAHYLVLAASLSLLSGLMVLGFGFLRLGFLSNLLSRPVVGGFISGSALLILLSQIKVVLGIQVSATDNWGQVVSIVEQLPLAHASTLALGGIGFIVLLGSRYFLAPWLVQRGMASSRAAMAVRVMPLLVVMVATVLSVALNFNPTYGMQLVGHVPSELPTIGFDVPTFADLQMLLAPALVLAFIGAVQNITMSHALAMKRHERTDANREMMGLGLSNIVTAFCGGMPVGGGLTRSAVNLASGAQSPLASIVSALFMLSIVLLGTQWFSFIPLCILAASIMVAAIGMIDFAGLRRAWRYDRADALAFLGTALGVIALNLQMGITLGIFLSLASLLYRASSPHIAVVGRIQGTEHFRNIERHGVETLPNAIFMRIDESLFFGNLKAIEDRLMREIGQRPQTQHVVLIMSAVNHIDVTALESLNEVLLALQTRGIHLHMAEVKGPVQDRLMNTALFENLAGRIYLSVNAAFELLNQALTPFHLGDKKH